MNLHRDSPEIETQHGRQSNQPVVDPPPSIGPWKLANRFILAPMAGVSEMPFRVLAFRLGAALCPTELVSAQGIKRANARTLRYLRFDPEVERPYALQLFGGEPEAMAEAAVVGKEKGAQLIDINMGCPVKKVVKNGAGSGLLRDPERAARMVRLIREATGLTVTCKIRSGWDAHSKNYLEMAAALEDAGCAALALHARTRSQGYSGVADWSQIGDLKRASKAMAIIGNGDVKNAADAERMLRETGCDFVMIGRGALGNPWLFRELAGGLPATPAERGELVLEHLTAHVAFVGDDLTAARTFRRHLGWYSHGLRGASAFRAEMNRLESPRDVELAVRRFFEGIGAEADAAFEGEQDIDYRQALG